MSKYVWFLDAGHGGVIDGVPQTAGKRSPKWEKGVLYEGVSNRIILAKVKSMLDKKCVHNQDITPEIKDISLSTRINRLNAAAGAVGLKRSIGLSFHSDGFNLESANGWSAYTYFGQTDSDKVATVLYKHAKKAKFKLRTDESDGDPDKEKNLALCRETNFPFVLIENLFMTNKKDYSVLKSESGQDKIAKMIFNAIMEIEENGLK